MKKTLLRPEPPKRLHDVNNALDRIENTNFAALLNDDETPSGRIVAYNDAVADTHYSEALTSYAVGWRDPEDLEMLLNEVAPVTTVGRRFEYRVFQNADEFLIDTDDERHTGASFKEVRRTSKLDTGKTVNRGLRVVLDHDEIDDIPGAEELWTGWILRRMIRSELYRALALLDAASTNAAKTWNSSANPDADMRAACQLALNASGMYPNTLLIGDAAWNLRQDSYEAQGTSNIAAVHAGYDLGRLASYLQLARARINKSRYQSSASAKSEMIGSKLYIYLAEGGLTTEDPSNIKRFVSPVQGGGQRRVYRQELDGKRVAITVEHYSQTKITSTLGIRKITPAA